MIDRRYNSKDKYLIVKAKGGMGNRMMSAITGILYGQLTSRKTVIDWRDTTYSNDGSNVFSRFFNVPQVFPEAILPENATVYPDIWTGQLHKSMSSMISEYDPDKHSSIFIHRKYSVDVRKLRYDEDILVFWNYKHRVGDLRRHFWESANGFAGLSTVQIIRKALREQLCLHEDIRRRIADFKNKNWHQTVIGLHIRYTDRKTSLARYMRPLQRFLKRSPHAHIFLATDNRQIQQEYYKRYKNVFSTPKWFPDGMSSMHHNPACPDRTIHGIEALVDMYLLADCDYLIYPGCSTFSWISRLLSDIPSERAVDTERFNLKVRLKNYIRDLVP